MAKKKTTKKVAKKPAVKKPTLKKKRLGTGTGKQHRTPEEKAEVKTKFLEGLRDNWGCIKDGMRRAGISREKYARLRKQDPDFDRECQEIIDGFVDDLEKSAMRRATEGSPKLVTSMGEVCGTDMVPETGLTIFMLKAKRREVFGDQVKVTISPDEFARQVQDLLGNEDESARSGLEGNKDENDD